MRSKPLKDALAKPADSGRFVWGKIGSRTKNISRKNVEKAGCERRARQKILIGCSRMRIGKRRCKEKSVTRRSGYSCSLEYAVDGAFA